MSPLTIVLIGVSIIVISALTIMFVGFPRARASMISFAYNAGALIVFPFFWVWTEKIVPFWKKSFGHLTEPIEVSAAGHRVDTSVVYIYDLAADHAAGRYDENTYAQMMATKLPEKFEVYLFTPQLKAGDLWFVPVMDVIAYRQSKGKAEISRWHAPRAYLSRKDNK